LQQPEPLRSGLKELAELAECILLLRAGGWEGGKELSRAEQAGSSGCQQLQQ
jgi:hypothetical protein